MTVFDDPTATLAPAMFLLGLRHGFDADHLAAIDALTRLHHPVRPRLARWVGSLFSLGHGGLIVVVALGLRRIGATWQPPEWLAPFGAWVSIGTLVLLGAANLRLAMRPPGDDGSLASRWRVAWLVRWRAARSPVAVVAIGALFALSFDALGLAALLAATGAATPGLAASPLTLGVLFLGGMVLTDGLNGLWLNHLLRRSRATSARAWRWMSAAVAGVSFATAASAVLAQTSESARDWVDAHQAVCSVAVCAVLVATFAIAHRRRGVGRKAGA